MATRAPDRALRKDDAPRRLTRCRRIGVGKEIGGCVYIHRSYEHLLPTGIFASAKEVIPPEFEYQVVKFCYTTGNVSFMQCPDFDSAPEPTVGNSWLVKPDGTLKTRAQARDPEIYHHKWLFVADDYRGFDVAASKCRSQSIMQLQGINRRRIGRKSYWEEEALPKLQEAGR